MKPQLARYLGFKIFKPLSLTFKALLDYGNHKFCLEPDIQLQTHHNIEDTWKNGKSVKGGLVGPDDGLLSK